MATDNSERVVKWQAGLAALLAGAAMAAVAQARDSTAADTIDDAALARAIRAIAQPVIGADSDYDRMLAAIGDARIVLLGEDTHGTHEHYVERARITKRLIAEKGFTALVVESDWPPAAIVGAAIETPGAPERIGDALQSFDRFPLWMWRNDPFKDLLGWMHAFNAARPPARPPVVFRGMDLYEIRRSIAAVIGYLDATDLDAAARARERYACFAPAGGDPQNYGSMLSNAAAADCSEPAQAQLTELATRRAPSGAQPVADPAWFDALQGARAVRDAEAYFRAMYRHTESSWNIRDAHMASSIDLLLAHLDSATESRARIVIWAHNAHIGDGRATWRAESNEWTLGQLLRERYPGDVFSVGFTTSRGTVYAATDWGGRASAKTLRPPLPRSHAAVFGRVGLPRFYFVPRESEPVGAALQLPRPQRGIGVRYLPALERNGHYYDARLSRQFDAVVHLERTTALRPRINDAPSGGRRLGARP